MHLKLLIITLIAYNSNCVYLNSSKPTENNPAKWTESEIWGPIFEDWILTKNRRVYENDTSIIDRSDEEKESKIASNLKIVNSNPVRNKPPQRQVTETEMYLLNAIEKMVYKVDFMEKRLRRVEQMLYFVMAGNKVDQEPCADNFNRAGQNCYLFAGTAGRELDWKAASKQCNKYGAALAEMETIEENQDVISYIQSQDHLRGREYWTGGLNPGLLWIWSNSARPIKTPTAPNKQDADPGSHIPGNGRCLRLAYNPSLRSYGYKGTDCSTRYSYICEIAENSATNELRRLGRSRKIIDEM
ncbi:uncharacterized protein LOC116172638 isoform X2 [Photinus pyralis]|uniref:uncharacterized protein LOC116172638 isoform X2 n=1 Tax=Photinus pyralis TaxID=7054 RepID=UPI0012670001|nr:uncharacterized protein LOC116172638 isoform X2 [Photinus pyralis]